VATYYLDTSALVKRYVREQGTTWVVSLAARRSGHDLFTVRLTGPELIAALTRKARLGGISVVEAERRARAFRRHWQRRYLIVEVTALIADRAMDVAAVHGLRGYDAVHLAAALIVEDARRAAGLPTLTFVSADDDQCQVARAEGLAVENPNTHP
jgi:predicted nucleic acid-binding protein